MKLNRLFIVQILETLKEMVDSEKYLTLPSGYKCPMVGLGTSKSIDPDIISRSIRCAVETGYRHIDTAYVYKNESGIGRALKECFEKGFVKREEMFITTKLFGTHQRREMVPIMLKKQLQLLGLDYLDLYLIHSPISLKHREEPEFPRDENGNMLFDLEATIEDCWHGMEDCVRMGLAKSIGVSNFNELQIERILKICTIKPSMLQIESHPYFQNKQLVEFCRSKQLPVTAYYALGSVGKVLKSVLGICIPLYLLQRFL